MRRLLVITAAVAALALVLAAGTAFYVLAYTRTGVELLVTQLDRLQNLGLRVDGVSGRLTGPLSIERLELDHERVHIVAEQVVLDLHLRWLALQTLDIVSATVASARVELKAAPDRLPSDRPPRFLPSFLRITVDQARIDHADLVLPNGTPVALGRVAAGLRLRPDRIFVDDAAVEGVAFRAGGKAELTAGRPVGIEVKGTGTYFDGDRPDLELEANLNGTADELTMDVTLHSPARATANLVFSRPEDAWRLAGRVTAERFALAPWVPALQTALEPVAFDVEARADGVRLDGRLGIPALSEAPFAVTADGRYGNRVLTLESVSVRATDAPARLAMSGTIGLAGDAPALALTAAWQQLAWPLSADVTRVASPSGELTLTGTLPYRFEVEAEVAAPRVGTVRGTVAGALAREDLRVDRYDLDLLDGNVTGAASLAFAARRWQLAATATDINPAPLHEELTGRLDVTTTAAGTGFDADADFELTVDRIRGTLRGERVDGAGRVSRTGDAWQVAETRLAFGSARMALDGTVAELVDMRWRIEAESLAEVWPDAAGRLHSSGHARGERTRPRVTAKVDGTDLRWNSWSAAAVDADIDIDPAGGTPSTLQVRGRRLQGGALAVESLALDGGGTPDAHSLAATVVSRTASGDPVTARLDVSGRYGSGAWTGQVSSGRLLDGPGNQPVRIAEPAPVVVSRDRIEVASLCLQVSSAAICGNGNWDRNGPWRVVASGDQLPLALVGELFDRQPDYLGSVSVDITAEGSPAVPWRGDASVVLTDAGFVYRLDPEDERSTETVLLGSGRLDLRATAGAVSAAVGVAVSAESFLAATATVTRQPGVPFRDSPLSGTLRGRMANANLLPILVTEIDQAAGVLTADVTASGTAGAPALEGRIDLARGGLDFYRMNLALRNLELGLRLTANRLQLAGTGNAGDGTFGVGGTLAWRNGEPSGTLQLKGEGLLVSDVPDYRVVASPDLTFAIDGRSIRASGEVVIPSARIEPSDLSGAVLASPDSRLAGDTPVTAESRFRVTSDIRIRLGNDVELDTFGLQGKLSGSVGTLMRPDEIATGRGELSIASGKYEAYGQNLDIARGRLLFDASPLDNPGLDIQAERRIETIRVGLNVRGTLREPRFGFYSEPAMSQTQVLSYLLVGKPLDDLQNRDAAAVGSARDTLAMQGGGILAAQIGRRLGLEEVGVQTQGANQMALVLGKFLSPRLFVSYGISLTESINTLKLRYTISDRWVVRTESGEEQSADVEFTILRP